METAKKQYHMETLSDEELLKTVGFRAATLRRNIVASVLLEKMVRREREVALGHPIGPEDFLEASHILVRVNEADPQKKDKAYADALAKLKGWEEEIKSGKTTFEKAAQEHSDDSTKFQGGTLGVFMRGSMVPEFDKAAFTQEPGKVGEPVKTMFGW